VPRAAALQWFDGIEEFSRLKLEMGENERANLPRAANPAGLFTSH
jgi:hypothetical protein